MKRIAARLLEREIVSLLVTWGMPETFSRTASHVMVETDLRGIDSHGVGMIPFYAEAAREGRLNLRPNIAVLHERQSALLIDADNGLGHPAAVMAMSKAIGKARETGVGIAGVTRSRHFGAAGYYAQMAADAGLIGLAFTNSTGPLAVPTFGREPFLGTNPIAFAAPAARNPSLVLDMATTTVAYGKITIARRAGKPIPEGWAVDEEGKAVTDANIAAKSRRLTPLGGGRSSSGHKGYGLALMVEVLCATMTGANKSAGETGHFVMAINPLSFGEDGAFEAGLDRLIDLVHGLARQDLDQSVLVPGDPEYAAYEERIRLGIPLGMTLLEELRAEFVRSELPFYLG
ncbi:Ldh family oxidoreductase [Gluconacetobacter aggeris]|uniref:Ldh family oxidoreductase n=1 Tax=Gluconacetobacter aggeris TaxID=1286186 RepID=A0A7W4NY05_9PROT|nr:Ldh family oxidoreductase [Gluconacetobacter aggeris]MBB2168073.1 Ldh family oxidoreductase [Gluconacetobacter aggeris]